ncbi:Tryptophan--tRNA ligase [Phytophthora cinnamomi]|uniref:Tryptophan--tRNA ligase n=1 Tax=Phytophthora cinnamomi TaxID=4785 RepID=UPI00355A0DB4|nr:Tryptophan--tRNA ligase [Phytophthora cinnamomi]
MVVYPKLVASAYANVRVLRDVLSCTLPIEIWFNVDELADFRGLFAPLQQLAISVGGISFHPMRGSQAKGFYSKIFAIQNSFFDRVLFLDADNVPVRDPSFLFESPEFVTTGALLDLPFIDMFEQESGQLLVDRVRHSAPLELVNFYAFHEPNYFQKLDLVYGDKDLFRLAWMKLNASFHMVQIPPAMAGRVIGGSFCGMTMAQHDANGEMLFLHRNQFKLTGERDSRFGNAAEEDPNALGAMQADGYPDPVIWTHLLSFNTTADSKMYLIDAYRAPPQFPDWQPCYGRRDVADLGVFYLKEFAKLTFANIETDLRRFAKEAIDLRP